MILNLLTPCTARKSGLFDLLSLFNLWQLFIHKLKVSYGPMRPGFGATLPQLSPQNVGPIQQKLNLQKGTAPDMYEGAGRVNCRNVVRLSERPRI